MELSDLDCLVVSKHRMRFDDHYSVSREDNLISVDESIRGRRGLQGNSFDTLSEVFEKRYVYECKAVAQERPYVSRPSRTQQLLNPKLVPKLTSDIHQDILRKKGVADEQIAKLESERGRKRNVRDEDYESPKKRSRSRPGSSSSSSVSTISTKASESSLVIQASSAQQPPHRREQHTMAMTDRKRRRSVSSENYSYPSDLEPNRRSNDMESSRSTRRKIAGLSPSTRGRRRSRSYSSNRRSSCSSEGHTRRNPGAQKWSEERTSRHRPYVEDADRSRYSSSLDRHARQRTPLERHARRDSFENEDASPPRKPRDRKRMSFNDDSDQERGVDTAQFSQRDSNFMAGSYGQGENYSRDRRQDVSSKTSERLQRRTPEASAPSRASRRERSLSPFSKRLALTKAMNLGR